MNFLKSTYICLVYSNFFPAKETGDHRLAQEGPLPSPIDIMTDFARLLSHSCHRVYRLTPDGLMTCEDTTLKRTVAATRDVETNSEVRTVKTKRGGHVCGLHKESL